MGLNVGNNDYAFEGNGPADGLDPSGLYEEDIHFYLTYYLALSIGLGDYKSIYYWGNTPQEGKTYVSDAYIIAWSDAFVDVHSQTEPLQKAEIQKGAAFGWLLFGILGSIYGAHNRNKFAELIRWTYHFRTEPGSYDKVVPDTPNTKKWLDQGIKECDPMLTGIGMHAYQDSWSHQGYGPYWGHFFSGHAPDWPWKDKKAAMDMAKATYDKLAEYMWKNYQKKPLKKWDDIKGNIDQLLDKYDQDNPENMKYRSDLWYNQTRQSFPLFNGWFESNGDQDGWAKFFLERALRVRKNEDL